MRNSLILSALAALGISSTAFATGTPPAPCTSPSKPDFSVVPFVMNNVGDCLTNQPGAVTNLYGQRVERIRIMFDEGPDAASALGFPEHFALSVLDDIDVNGKMVGSGPTRVSYDDEDRGEGQGDGGRDWRFRGSGSHPEGTEFQYSDSSSGKNVQGVNGARSTTYSNGPMGEKCVNIVGDALVNGSAGYLYNFVACDLWLFGGLASYAVTLSGGPSGPFHTNRRGPYLPGT